MTESHLIERLGHRGDGIAAGPVYAPRTMPGETVRGVRDGAQLTDIRIDRPSPDRVQPPCRHYKGCGGCQLQHASDRFVAGWKQDVVRAALAAQGLGADLRPIHTSPPASRRRATIAVRRTKSGALAGFHARASDVIVEIPDCRLLHPDLLQGLDALRDLAAIGAGRKSELAVTMTRSEAGLDVAVDGGKPLDGPLRAALGQAAARFRLARLSWGGETVAQNARPVQRFGAAAVVPPPGAFLQATADGEAALRAAVREIVGTSRHVADLFAGCGTFTLPLAETGEVHGVEGDGAMLAALDSGWRQARGLKRVTTETRDLFRNPLTAEELARFDAVVLDPPRAGAEAQVAQIAAARVPVVAHVSCNPVTFARDAGTLIRAGYGLDWVQVVDQFRWSAHTELAAAFRLSH